MNTIVIILVHLSAALTINTCSFQTLAQPVIQKILHNSGSRLVIQVTKCTILQLYWLSHVQEVEQPMWHVYGMEVGPLLKVVMVSIAWIPWNLSFRYVLFHEKRLQTMLWHHNARVNSPQRWKQRRFRVCFHLWCELTSTMIVTEWHVSWNPCPSLHLYHPLIYL